MVHSTFHLVCSKSVATKKKVIYFQFVIDNQLLPCLRQLFTREYTKNLFKEASWTIAVITSWTQAQVQVRKANGSLSPCYFSRKNRCPVKKVDRRV